MPDKSLTEAAWKAFAKGGDYKDAALLKALSALDKSERGGAQAQLDALADLEKQADLLRKAHKADKKVVEYLDTLDKALARQRKAAETELENEKKKASADEEEESPALLTTRMVPLLREVRKPDVVLQALIAIAGKETVVLVSKRAISPTRGKLLKEQMANSGGLKFIRGEVLFEAGAVTFVLQSPAAGLAKKISAALLHQTEMRLKVRVRGEDPDDIDEDGENEGVVPGGETPSSVGNQGAGETAATGPDPQQQRYEDRLAQLEPRVADALRRRTADASRIRAVEGFAREKAAARTWAAALQGLDSLEKLLVASEQAATPPGTPKEQDGRVDPAEAFKARLGALMPRIRDALAAGGPSVADIRAKVAEAGALAQKRDYPPAQAVLDEVEQLLGDAAAPRGGERDGGERSDGERTATDPGSTGRGTPGLVQQRIFMLTRWKRIPEELKGNLAGLQQSIVAGEADDDPQEIVDGISTYLDDLLSDLQDEMDAAINAGDTGAFKGLADRVSSDALLQLLADNPAIDGGAFRTNLLGALREIEEHLAG